MELPGPALWHVFADGARIVTTDGATPPHTHELGYLTLPTGRIVASDPFLDPWTEPFSARAPRGSHAAFVSVVDDGVALVMVSFGGRQPVSWRPAEPRAFGVDSATGCLMDQKVCHFLRRKAEADRYERYARRFQDALDEAGGMWADCRIDPETGANVLLFHTWGGDGHFPSFFGYTGDGLLACLVIDMYLSDEGVVGVGSATAE